MVRWAKQSSLPCAGQSRECSLLYCLCMCVCMYVCMYREDIGYRLGGMGCGREVLQSVGIQVYTGPWSTGGCWLAMAEFSRLGLVCSCCVAIKIKERGCARILRAVQRSPAKYEHSTPSPQAQARTPRAERVRRGAAATPADHLFDFHGGAGGAFRGSFESFASALCPLPAATKGSNFKGSRSGSWQLNRAAIDCRRMRGLPKSDSIWLSVAHLTHLVFYTNTAPRSQRLSYAE